MSSIKRKLKDNRGASLIYGLFLLIVVMMISATILAASVTGIKRLYNDKREKQAHLTLASAAMLVNNELKDSECESIKTHTYYNEDGIALGYTDPAKDEVVISAKGILKQELINIVEKAYFPAESTTSTTSTESTTSTPSTTSKIDPVTFSITMDIANEELKDLETVKVTMNVSKEDDSEDDIYLADLTFDFGSSSQYMMFLTGVKIEPKTSNSTDDIMSGTTVIGTKEITTTKYELSGGDISSVFDTEA